MQSVNYHSHTMFFAFNHGNIHVTLKNSSWLQLHFTIVNILFIIHHRQYICLLHILYLPKNVRGKGMYVNRAL